jgi:hypothetical protein
VPTWTESERELGRWIEQRFPGGGPAQERLARADRRRFLRPEPIGLGLLVIALFADPADQRRLWSPPGPVRAWEAAVWVAAAVLAAATAAVALRRRMRDGMWRSWVLDALTRAQRRELEAEARGLRPVVPGDEAALRQVARQWASGVLDAARAGALVLALLPAEIADPGAWTGAVKLAVLVVLVAEAGLALTRWRAGAAYLRRETPAWGSVTAC